MSKKPTSKAPLRARTKACSGKGTGHNVERDEGQRKPPKRQRRRQKPATTPVASKRRKQFKSEAETAPTTRRPRPAGDTRDYDVGRGKPPREYSWKPGESGNRKGRPKGSKNESTIWKEIMRRKITIPIGGKPKKVTVQEAIQYRIANDALNGNVKSANFVLNRITGIITDIAAAHMAEDDQAVLNAYLRSIKQKISESDDDN